MRGQNWIWHPHISPASSTSCDLQKPPYLLDFSLSPYCKRLRLIQNKADRFWEPLINTATHSVVYRTTSVSCKDIQALKDLHLLADISKQTVKKWETELGRRIAWRESEYGLRSWPWKQGRAVNHWQFCQAADRLRSSDPGHLRPKRHTASLGNAWPSGGDTTRTAHSVCGHVHTWTGAGDLMLLVLSFIWMRTSHII